MDELRLEIVLLCVVCVLTLVPSDTPRPVHSHARYFKTRGSIGWGSDGDWTLMVLLNVVNSVRTCRLLNTARDFRCSFCIATAVRRDQAERFFQ